MASCNTKAKAIMVVLVGLFGLLCVGFAVSVTEKYHLQKERVHGLEKQLAAGRKEVLKVPTLIQKLDKEKASKAEIEEKYTECNEEKEEVTEQLEELQAEVNSFGAVKAAVTLQISELETVIEEQQQDLNAAVEEKATLQENINSIKDEYSSAKEKFELQLADIKSGNKEMKKQLDYLTNAQKKADNEIEEKKKIIQELEAELAKLKEKGSEIKMPDALSPGEGEVKTPLQESWELGSVTEELDKTFALLRQRISSPTMSHEEVCILLSRAEKALQELK